MDTRDALKCAIDHIEHMAAWIGKLNSGYSFESLGEDMPGIKAALAQQPRPEQEAVAAKPTGRWTMGEVVNPKNLGNMTWAPYEEAVRYLNVNTFLGRWREYDEHGHERQDRDRIAFCCQNDDGDVLALGDHATDGEPMNPTWRVVDGPDEILVVAPAPSAEVVEALNGMYAKLAASPLGMISPWESKPSGGKPYLSGGRRGTIAYGTIGTWDELAFVAALVNAWPLLSAALASPAPSDAA